MLMQKQCGDTTFTLVSEDGQPDGPRRTVVRIIEANGAERALARPPLLEAYTAVGLGCATSSTDGVSYLVVQYGELSGGCAFCEWFHLYDARGDLLTANSQEFFTDETLPPAQQRYPDNESYEAMLKQLNLVAPEIEYAN